MLEFPDIVVFLRWKEQVEISAPFYYSLKIRTYGKI